MIDQFRHDYREAILDTNRQLAFAAIDDALAGGNSPESVIFDILIPVMEELAEIVRVGPDATLAQLYLASQISSEVSDRLTPLFEKEVEDAGTIIIGTAFEDFHGLGKKIVGGCLKSQMVKVIDLGLNVPAEKFVDEAINHDAEIIGISSMMLHTARGADGPTRVRQLMRERGLEDKIQLVVGGAPYRFHPDLYREVGADAWAENGISAVGVISDLIAGRRAS